MEDYRSVWRTRLPPSRSQNIHSLAAAFSFGSQDSSISQPCNASPPFDHPKADVILRSSDNVEFRVFKIFLSLASPFFESLFELPQPSEEKSEDTRETKGDLAIIPVSEDSRTLDALLRFCYPCTLAKDPPLDHFKDVVNVLEAAKKYSLDEVENAISQALFNPKILEVESLRCFAVARRARLRDQTIMAAKYTLREPLIPGWFEEVDLVTASDFLALLTYHQKCGSTLQELYLNFNWITKHYQNRAAGSWMLGQTTAGQACICPKSKTVQLFGQYCVLWWEEFMKATFEALKDRPCADTVREMVEKVVEEVRRRECLICCSNVATTAIPEFTTLFVKLVDKLVSKVRFVVQGQITIMMTAHRWNFLYGIEVGHYESIIRSCFYRTNITSRINARKTVGQRTCMDLM